MNRNFVFPAAIEVDLPSGKLFHFGTDMTTTDWMGGFSEPTCNGFTSGGVSYAPGDHVPSWLSFVDKNQGLFYGSSGNNGVGNMDLQGQCEAGGPMAQSVSVRVCGDSLKFYLGFWGEEALTLFASVSGVKEFDGVTPRTSHHIALQSEFGGRYIVSDMDIVEFASKDECLSA